LEAVKMEGERALEDTKRRGQEEIERLRREVQAAKDSEQRSREEAQRRDFELSQLRGDLEQQQDGTSRSTEQLRKLEQRALDMEEELNRERAASRQRSASVSESRRKSEMELTRISSEAEELRMKMRQVNEQREQLDSDFKHLQKANGQREEECKQLRASITEEKHQVRLLQAELSTRKAEVNMVAARAQLESDTAIARKSIASGSFSGSFSDGSPVATAERTLVRESTTFDTRTEGTAKLSLRGAPPTRMFSVDLTESPTNPDVAKRSSLNQRTSVGQSSGATGQFKLEQFTVDINEDDSD